MRIRKATNKDLEIIIKMGEALQNESRTHEPLLIFNRKESYSNYERELSNTRALIIVAAGDDDELMGYQYSFITTLDYLSSANKECTYEALYVVPEFRGFGVGRALTKAAEDWAINQHGVNRIRANIYSGNTPSISLHTKDGFSPYCTEYIKLINNNE
jgi:GNAT superfamily N-acetyltransferase